MSMLEMSDTETNDVANHPAEYKPTSFLGVLTRSFKAKDPDRIVKRVSLESSQEFTKIGARYKELTGKNVSELIDNRLLATQKSMRRGTYIDDNFAYMNQRQIDIIDTEINKLRAHDPEKYEGIETYSEVRDRVFKTAQKRENLTDQELHNAKQGYGSGAWVADLLGGLGAAMTDPVNVLASVGFGGGAFVKTALGPMQNIARIALTEAGINAGVEILQHPEIADWHHQLNRQYGLKDAATNVAIAALGGGLFSGGIAAGFRGVNKAGFDRSIMRSELGAQLKERNLGGNQKFIDAMNEMNQDPTGFLARLRDANLDKTTKHMAQDLYVKMKETDTLALGPGRTEASRKVFDDFMAQKNKEGYADTDAMLFLLNIDEQIANRPRNVRTHAMLEDMRDFFRTEIHVMKDIRLDTVPDSFLNKVSVMKKLRALSETERVILDKLKLTIKKKGKIRVKEVNDEIARRKAKGTYQPGTQTLDGFLKDKLTKYDHARVDRFKKEGITRENIPEVTLQRYLKHPEKLTNEDRVMLEAAGFQVRDKKGKVKRPDFIRAEKELNRRKENGEFKDFDVDSTTHVTDFRKLMDQELVAINNFRSKELGSDVHQLIRDMDAKDFDLKQTQAKVKKMLADIRERKKNPEKFMSFDKEKVDFNKIMDIMFSSENMNKMKRVSLDEMTATKVARSKEPISFESKMGLKEELVDDLDALKEQGFLDQEIPFTDVNEKTGNVKIKDLVEDAQAGIGRRQAVLDCIQGKV